MNLQEAIARYYGRSEPASSGESAGECDDFEAEFLSSATAILAMQAHSSEASEEKEMLLVNIVRTLVSAIEAKDKYTCGHSERVALFSRRLGQELGLSEEACKNLYLAGLLHDVGKIGVSDAILSKPTRLTVEQYDEIKRHPDLGWSMLRDFKPLRYVLPGVVHHHERVDGAGYPDGLIGTQIPLDGRILAVADAYDAMTSDRPYRRGLPIHQTLEVLVQGAGTQWDSEVVRAFMRIASEIEQIAATHQQSQYGCQAANSPKLAEPTSIESAAVPDAQSLRQSDSPARWKHPARTA